MYTDRQFKFDCPHHWTHPPRKEPERFFANQASLTRRRRFVGTISTTHTRKLLYQWTTRQPRERLKPDVGRTRPERSQKNETLRFSRISDYLAIGAQPTGRALYHLMKSGFKHIIDLNANPEEADEALRIGICYHPIEVRDSDPIQVWLSKFDLAVEIIRRASKNAESVYLHCTYGKGRSPTVAMAYLLTEGHTIEEAIATVKSKHHDVWSPGNPTLKYTETLDAYAKLKLKSNRLQTA